MSLEALLRERADLWQGRRVPGAAPPGVATGFAALDAELPGGGWPRGALTELLSDDGRLGLPLLLPAFARLARDDGRWQPWVAPPATPYAPALAARGIALERLLLVAADGVADAAWALEQGLRSGGCAAIAGWLADASGKTLRRLQLAAETAAVPVFLFLPARLAGRPSPAPLRLRVAPDPGGLRVELLKRRGRPLGRPLLLAHD